ncbi:sodium/potassium-transporting ATPase subunit beta [Hyalella azteca]|uniref:Sodium/potassium-transporting ATPase subunit beta n=1 Tax=Hyalella azteca TaxID=294128 RepID=A0A8B7NSR0_HYAAZ|nr:sodium/potassium-transporting ATPase subunit beta [Hyalella azteca]
MAQRDTEFFEHEKESFMTFLYNKEAGTVMGRTGMSWLKIGTFYVIFYSFLAGFFAVMMTVFYQTLDVNFQPTYTPGDGSSILAHPALGFRPLPRSDNVESTLIWYKSSDPEDVKHWIESLNEFIKPYEGTQDVSGQHLVECSEENLPEKDQVCKFQDTWLTGNCHKAESWGYKLDSPCVIIKLNKMFGWEPDVYTSLDELPDDMPQDLKDHIAAEQAAKGGKIPKMIWMSCEGENPADQEYVGPIRYSPWRGFPSYYFPYRNTPGYLSPIVALEFTRLQPYVLINVECKAWAKNIVHDSKNRLGLVHFEILKD